MNWAAVLFLRSVNQHGRNWPCELSCAFEQPSTSSFLSCWEAGCSTPAAPSKQRRGWEANPTLRSVGSGLGLGAALK